MKYSVHSTNPQDPQADKVHREYDGLLHRFRYPHFCGTEEEWNLLKQCTVEVTPAADGTIRAKCPHCTWTNTHEGDEGHRECDGPFHAMRTEDGVELSDYVTYDCPGYTLKIIEGTSAH